jgi:hypothetical protein
MLQDPPMNETTRKHVGQSSVGVRYLPAGEVFVGLTQLRILPLTIHGVASTRRNPEDAGGVHHRAKLLGPDDWREFLGRECVIHHGYVEADVVGDDLGGLVEEAPELMKDGVGWLTKLISNPGGYPVDTDSSFGNGIQSYFRPIGLVQDEAGRVQDPLLRGEDIGYLRREGWISVLRVVGCLCIYVEVDGGIDDHDSNLLKMVATRKRWLVLFTIPITASIANVWIGGHCGVSTDGDTFLSSLALD